MATTNTLVHCPECGAYVKTSHRQCWMCHAMLHFPHDGESSQHQSGDSSSRHRVPTEETLLGFLIAIFAVIPASTIAFFVICTLAGTQGNGSWSAEDGRTQLTSLFGGLIVFVLTVLFAVGIGLELVDQDRRR